MAKLKNTYSIKFGHMIGGYSLFEYCRNTPLVIAQKNGKQMQNDDTWDVATEFPNPGAVFMGTNFGSLKEHMGEKLATTIIEYLDKDTRQPVVTLFPAHVHIHDGYEGEYEKHLNHASRKDLDFQMMMRRRALENMR